MTEPTKRPATKQARRAPAPDERTLDAERSRRLLLDAALEEFSAKGYAGARVQDIADRAGVNKQLINYYFGGKQGLYCDLHRRWLEREAEFNDPDVPFDEIVVRYLEHALADPRGTRLNAWRGLTEDLDDIPAGPREDLSDIERRQAARTARRPRPGRDHVRRDGAGVGAGHQAARRPPRLRDGPAVTRVPGALHRAAPQHRPTADD
ncbi:TetR/AcrR family transcriptional regulator [Actinomadura luteofluorescens]|uniref:TetR/AcrR family transcriptional regulator n=1 Tax=Actinomadura luteofluorescens TaxID=46163 RepID=UPI003642BE12